MSHVYAGMYEECESWSVNDTFLVIPCADPEGGGTGGPDHPEKSQKCRVS